MKDFSNEVSDYYLIIRLTNL